MKVIELDKEKSRTEMAFHDFVPPAVVKRIKSKKGKEVYKEVQILNTLSIYKKEYISSSSDLNT